MRMKDVKGIQEITFRIRTIKETLRVKYKVWFDIPSGEFFTQIDVIIVGGGLLRQTNASRLQSLGH